MRAIAFGRQSVAVSTDGERWPAVDDFLGRVARPSTTSPDLSLRIFGGDRASLAIDDKGCVAALTLPTDRLRSRPDPSLHIALLQVAARGLAFLGESDRDVLLHGSAATTGHDGDAVAVLDGGTGGGKTSLALALTAAGGTPLVDEFLFAQLAPDGATIAPSPDLPWHVRADMSPVLTPARRDQRLQFPDELVHDPLSANHELPLAAILVPDMRRQPGEVVAVGEEDARGLLGPAVDDHRAKLLDPRLDHVTPFSTPRQIMTPAGTPLAELHQHSGSQRSALEVLVRIPVLHVGIGRPSDLPKAARASLAALDRLALHP